uniref:Uncharacterized protein n=1 Tax=Anguilla anguilla TaxID=7936 RepID=A0A0E9TR41_ANGAN
MLNLSYVSLLLSEGWYESKSICFLFWRQNSKAVKTHYTLASYS